MSSSSKLHGTFSRQMVNRIDDKWRTISRWILEIIYKKLSTLKSPTILTDTLYYTVNTTEQLKFIYTVGNSPYSGITTTHMTYKNFEIDPFTLITFVGYRIVPDPIDKKSKIVSPLYNETITLENKNGMLSAVATYVDSGDGFKTTNLSQTYMVLNGTDKYAYAKTITIYFNNIAGTRRIEVNSYQ